MHKADRSSSKVSCLQPPPCRAAPHVAGAAARIWVDFPGCPAAEVGRALKEGAKPMPGVDAVSVGAGMLQVEAAYNKLRTYPCAAAAAAGGDAAGGGGAAASLAATAGR